jgi:hypothetical protein
MDPSKAFIHMWQCNAATRFFLCFGIEIFVGPIIPSLFRTGQQFPHVPLPWVCSVVGCVWLLSDFPLCRIRFRGWNHVNLGLVIALLAFLIAVTFLKLVMAQALSISFKEITQVILSMFCLSKCPIQKSLIY